MKNLKPITRQETLLAKVAGQDVPDLVPITREEFFLAKAAGQDVPELEPITREEYFLADVIEAIESGGGGGGSDLGTKNISANGTYKASDDSLDGYSKVTVDVPASAVDSGTKTISANGTYDVTGYASASVSVPNSYAAGDEGKVVSNGALVAQSSDTVTENDTYDTTMINSLTVNVSGGGSDENFEKLLDDTLVTVDNSNLRSLRQGAFTHSTNLVTVNLPNVTSATHEIFLGCYNLREVHMPKWAGNIGNDCFINNKKLEVFDAPNITQAGNNAFAYCEKLTLQILPKFTTMNGTILFRDCPFTVMVLPMLTTARTNMLLTCNNCVTVDIGENLASIPLQMLNSNAALENIVLRRTSSITALSNANGLWGNTNEPSVHKKIYVPSALISTYQTATNWATLFNAGYITFHAIEGSTYENAYADGTPISS